MNWFDVDQWEVINDTIQWRNNDSSDIANNVNQSPKKIALALQDYCTGLKKTPNSINNYTGFKLETQGPLNFF